MCYRHAHKHTVMDLRWNRNGNWLLTASRDHLLKLFDIRNMKEEMQSFRGHKREATSEQLTLHLFASQFLATLFINILMWILVQCK